MFKDQFQKSIIAVYSGFNRWGVLNWNVGFVLFKTFYFIYKRFYEDPYFRFIKNYPELHNRGHVIDIGANIGYTTDLFTQTLIGPNQKVFAFEPEERNFTWLLKVIRPLGDQVVAIKAAVGATMGETNIIINEGHHGDHRVFNGKFLNTASKVQNISMITIDQFLKDEHISPSEVGFVKIDVQGFELEVLKGMMKTLIESDLTLGIEMSGNELENFGTSITEIIFFLNELGYYGAYLNAKGCLTNIPSNKPYFDMIFSKKLNLLIKK